MENMENLSINEASKGNSDFSDLSSVGIGAAIGGPFGAMAGYGANKLFKWARRKYLDKQQKKKDNTKNSTDSEATKQPEQQTDQSKEKEPLDKDTRIKNAQDKILNDGMFEPEFYKCHKFYMTRIYDSINLDNNFVYLSDKRNGAKAYKAFLEYWTEKFKAKRKYVTEEDIKSFQQSVKERFLARVNNPCYISTPKEYYINIIDVKAMAKNSDIAEQLDNIYNDIPSFDSNYFYDIHMQKFKNESVEADDCSEYKITYSQLSIFGTNYVFATDANDTSRQIRDYSDDILLAIGEHLSQHEDENSRLYTFSKIIEKLIDSEKSGINVYTVAAPLLTKYNTDPRVMENNAILLDGVGIYLTEEEFKEHYLEDYQKLLENQMGL